MRRRSLSCGGCQRRPDDRDGDGAGGRRRRRRRCRRKRERERSLFFFVERGFSFFVFLNLPFFFFLFFLPSGLPRRGPRLFRRGLLLLGPFVPARRRSAPPLLQRAAPRRRRRLRLLGAGDPPPLGLVARRRAPRGSRQAPRLGGDSGDGPPGRARRLRQAALPSGVVRGPRGALVGAGAARVGRRSARQERFVFTGGKRGSFVGDAGELRGEGRDAGRAG